VIRVIDKAGDVIETHEQPRELKPAGNENCNLDKPAAISYLKSCDRFAARFCTGIVLTSGAILTMNWFLFAKSLSQAIHPMNKKSQTIKSILTLFTLVSLTSYATAGQSITQEKINQIRAGQTTEEDLVRAFGPPATKTVCPPRETALEWFYSSPISAQNYIPIIGPALNGMQVKAWELWVVVGLNGEVKRYIAYGHYVNGEVKRYIEYGHYPH